MLLLVRERRYHAAHHTARHRGTEAENPRKARRKGEREGKQNSGYQPLSHLPFPVPVLCRLAPKAGLARLLSHMPARLISSSASSLVLILLWFLLFLPWAPLLPLT